MKTILITGTSGGIGEALANKLADLASQLNMSHKYLSDYFKTTYETNGTAADTRKTDRTHQRHFDNNSIFSE